MSSVKAESGEGGNSGSRPFGRRRQFPKILRQSEAVPQVSRWRGQEQDRSAQKIGIGDYCHCCLCILAVFFLLTCLKTNMNDM